MRIRVALLHCALCVWPAVAGAQERPFLFSVSTAGSDTRGANVHVDVGVGEREFVFDGDQGVSQTLGLQAVVARGVTVLASASTALGDAGVSGRGAGGAEVLFDLRRGASRRTSLAVGGGVRHEYLGTNTARVRIVAGHDVGRTRLLGNLLLEKPLANGRDAVDVISSLGWVRPVTSALSLGVEAIGEDLEGFWEADEAEGGARLLVGPSLQLRGARWRFTVGGGPVFHPSRSGRVGAAPRQLPQNGSGTGYAVQSSFSCLF